MAQEKLTALSAYLINIDELNRVNVLVCHMFGLHLC